MPKTAHKTKWYSTGGPWGTGLLLIGVAVTVQGFAYISAGSHSLSPALALVNQGFPIAAWGGLWLGAGLYSIVRALMPPQRSVDVVPAVTVICLWGAIYFVHWIYRGCWQGYWSREWMQAVAWGSLACLLICFSRCVNPPGRR